MIIVGVDAGGTSTRAIAFDDECNFLGRGNAGPGNFHNVGLDSAKRNILNAIFTATKGKKADFVVVGAAGLDSKYDWDLLTSSLRDIGNKVVLEHDSFIVLYAEAEKPRGIVVISGTGSVVVGYDGDKRIRAGGYGWLLADEGSGYWIGREALRILVKMLDGRLPKTLLAERILESIKQKSLDDVIKWAYYEGHKVDEIAKIAMIVCDIADKDPHALKIIEEATKELAEDVIYVSKVLNLKEVYVSGGLFNSRIYYEKFYSNLKGFNITKVSRDPVMGAILYAFDLLDLRKCKEVVREMKFD